MNRMVWLLALGFGSFLAAEAPPTPVQVPPSAVGMPSEPVEQPPEPMSEGQEPGYTFQQIELSSCYRIPEFDESRDIVESEALNEVTIEFGYEIVHRRLLVIVDAKGQRVYQKPIQFHQKRNASFGAYWSVNFSNLPKGADKTATLQERKARARAEAIESYRQWVSFNRLYLCSPQDLADTAPAIRKH